MQGRVSEGVHASLPTRNSHHQMIALARQRTGERHAQSRYPSMNGRMDLIQHAVGVVWIVVKQHEVLDAGGDGNIQGIRPCRMPPPATPLQLFGRILRIVDEDIGSLEKPQESFHLVRG